jgi:hypothetical protein
MSLRRRVRGWLTSRLPRSDTQLLTQGNIYILPTRAGWLFALTMLVLLLASINYQLNLGYILTFLLAGSGVVSMHITHGTLRGLTLHLRPVAPAFAGAAAVLDIVMTSPGTPPLTYQWRLNGTNVGAPTTTSVLSNSFVVANVQTNDVGRYTVVVSNTVRGVTSTFAYLDLVTALTGSNAVPSGRQFKDKLEIPFDPPPNGINLLNSGNPRSRLKPDALRLFSNFRPPPANSFVPSVDKQSGKPSLLCWICHVRASNTRVALGLLKSGCTLSCCFNS